MVYATSVLHLKLVTNVLCAMVAAVGLSMLFPAAYSLFADDGLLLAFLFPAVQPPAVGMLRLSYRLTVRIPSMRRPSVSSKFPWTLSPRSRRTGALLHLVALSLNE
jgi:hypothetical protein